MFSRGRANTPLLISIELLLGLLMLGGCRTSNAAKATAQFPRGTGFVRHQFRFDGATRSVWMFVPKNYRRAERYPTIVFLHGLFEAGDDSEKCLSAGLGPVIARSPDDWQFITIFPQSNGTWRGEDRQRFVMAALNSVEERWSVDLDRVTLAGLSYGALGVWEIGANNPDRFAALVPIAGPGATELVPRLRVLPVWAFNFRGDLIISSSGADEMCEQITDQGGNALQTKFDGVGHDCWDRAVAESDLVDWMLHQRRDLARVYNSPPASIADVR
ncbi:hypothetical protein BH09PLA1_BH09PLA1_33850 [soil metagenome]